MLGSKVLTVALFVAGCGSAATGTNPHDMSVAQHAAMARHAKAQAQQHDEAPTVTYSTGCRGGGPSLLVPTQICWTGSEHRSEAAYYRDLARKHRQASAALVQAEERACAGLSEDDRAMSPFFHREDVLAVNPLDSRTDPIPAKIVGSTVIFRAVPGLSVERLQRAIDCHLARAAALGHQVPEMAYCPLALKGVSATVVAVESGFAVEVSATDDATVQEVVRRARALRDDSSRPTSPAGSP